MLIFLIFCEYATNNPLFAQDWLQLQLERLGANQVGSGLSPTVNSAYLEESSASGSNLLQRAGVSTLSELTLEIFVDRVMLVDSTANEADRAFLTPAALSQVRARQLPHQQAPACCYHLPSPATYHQLPHLPPPTTHHPPPATRHPPPATRHPQPTTRHQPSRSLLAA